jgi:hypothetical protein
MDIIMDSELNLRNDLAAYAESKETANANEPVIK